MLQAPAALVSSCREESRRNPAPCPGTACGWCQEEARLPEQPLQLPQEQCLGPFPADFISYWVTCSIASSSATSSIHRGRRISCLFLLIVAGTSSLPESRPVQETAAPAGGSSVLPLCQRAGGLAEAVPLQCLAASPLPQHSIPNLLLPLQRSCWALQHTGTHTLRMAQRARLKT